MGKFSRKEVISRNRHTHYTRWRPSKRNSAWDTIRSLETGNPSEREAALVSVGALNPDFCPKDLPASVLNMFADPQLEVRIAAAHALEYICSWERESFYRAILDSDPLLLLCKSLRESFFLISESGTATESALEYSSSLITIFSCLCWYDSVLNNIISLSEEILYVIGSLCDLVKHIEGVKDVVLVEQLEQLFRKCCGFLLIISDENELFANHFSSNEGLSENFSEILARESLSLGTRIRVMSVLLQICMSQKTPEDESSFLLLSSEDSYREIMLRFFESGKSSLKGERKASISFFEDTKLFFEVLTNLIPSVDEGLINGNSILPLSHRVVAETLDGMGLFDIVLSNLISIQCQISSQQKDGFRYYLERNLETTALFMCKLLGYNPIHSELLVSRVFESGIIPPVEILPALNIALRMLIRTSTAISISEDIVVGMFEEYQKFITKATEVKYHIMYFLFNALHAFRLNNNTHNFRRVFHELTATTSTHFAMDLDISFLLQFMEEFLELFNEDEIEDPIILNGVSRVISTIYKVTKGEHWKLYSLQEEDLIIVRQAMNRFQDYINT